jgi:hypothetical protein
MNWAAFEVSTAELEDRRTHSMQIRHPDHQDVRLVVWHMQVPLGKTVREFAARRVAEEMTRLEGYTILEQREVPWCETPAIEIASRWRYEGPCTTRGRRTSRPATPCGRSRSPAPIASGAACDTWFEEIRASLRLRS